MTQYNLKPGLRKFGVRGATAAIDKLTQSHMMDTWTVMDPSKLTQEDQVNALSLLLFVKEKQTGTIKGRACIDRAPQQVYMLIPKWSQTLFWNGESPYGNFEIYLPISIHGVPMWKEGL
jgi:hypothetical protein